MIAYDWRRNETPVANRIASSLDAVLQGLGFDAEESKTRPVSSLSGGERGRVGLAAQLIAPADHSRAPELTSKRSR